MMNYGYYNSTPCSSQQKVLKVNGSGTVKAQPNIAIINLGVITEDMSLQTAQKENAVKTNSVLDSLYKMNIPKRDISTAVFDIQPQYDYVEGKQEFRGYRVTNILSVTIRDLTMVGEVIDTATANGANRVDNIRFTIEDPSLYYNRALTLAVRSATEKAKQLANDFGVQLSPIPHKITEESSVSITEDSPTMKLAASPTPILPGQLDITARIEVTFEYR
jgi:uncharacterized protein YggE